MIKSGSLAKGLTTIFFFGIIAYGLALAFPIEGACSLTSASLDARINHAICPISSSLASLVFFTVPFFGGEAMFVVLLLIGTALVLTFYLNFVNIRGLRQSWRVLKKGRTKEKEGAGELSHFQAMTAALSGTVGLGNIAGVAIAISIGGPGAIFWMVIAGFLAMATKFAECTIGHQYRHIHKDGSVSGGAMYYLTIGLGQRRMPMLGSILASAFALFCVGVSLGAGNMFQANQAFEQLDSVVSHSLLGYGWLFGTVVAVLVAFVIIGGIKSIGRVTEKLVPTMGAIYIIGCLLIIMTHIGQLPETFAKIIHQAFTPDAQYGGIIGVMMWGFRRALFSNEAGLGSAPIAYAAVKTKNSASVGYIALLGPFIDTVVICTMTGLVIVISGSYLGTEGLTGVTMTSQAFASVASWFPYVLTVAILLFSFSTLITWSYYGLKGWSFLFGESKFTEGVFKTLFCVCIVVGAAMDVTQIVNLSDAMIFLMLVPNLVGLIIFAPTIRKHLTS